MTILEKFIDEKRKVFSFYKKRRGKGVCKGPETAFFGGTFFENRF